MVFGLVTGAIGVVVDVVDDAANGLDAALFGHGNVPPRTKSKIIEDAAKLKEAGFTDAEIKKMLENKYV